MLRHSSYCHAHKDGFFFIATNKGDNWYVRKLSPFNGKKTDNLTKLLPSRRCCKSKHVMNMALPIHETLVSSRRYAVLCIWLCPHSQQHLFMVLPNSGERRSYFYTARENKWKFDFHVDFYNIYRQCGIVCFPFYYRYILYLIGMK